MVEMVCPLLTELLLKSETLRLEELLFPCSSVRHTLTQKNSAGVKGRAYSPYLGPPFSPSLPPPVL